MHKAVVFTSPVEPKQTIYLYEGKVVEKVFEVPIEKLQDTLTSVIEMYKVEDVQVKGHKEFAQHFIGADKVNYSANNVKITFI